MILFAVSFFLIFCSSYFLSSVLTKKAYEHFCYLLLTAFAQIILTFEILSLFKAINATNILIANTIFFIFTVFVWIKFKKPIYIPDFKPFFNKFFNSLKLDKTLLVLFLGYLVLIIGAIILNSILPIINADADDYHVARSVWFALNGSLNHIQVADIRALSFPINSEILYSWVFALAKKEVFIGYFSFFGYLLAIASLFKMMAFLNFSMRKKLWVIFILSSLPFVLIQLSSSETDILLSSLLLASLMLFWTSLKEKNKTALFMASLSYAIALGTKTTAIIAIPAIGILMLYLCHYYKNYKNFFIFLGFGILNFIIFSSYNYILNLINYENIMGATSAIVVHKNFYGIKGMIASFVKHLFLFVDFTGFKWSWYFGEYIMDFKNSLLGFLHVLSVPDGIYSNPAGKFEINNTLFEPTMGPGILGFLVLLPCLILSPIKQFFHKKNKTVLFLTLLACAFLIYIFTLSYIIVYMNYNVRFLATFTTISAPILGYSYFRKNNLLKTIIVVFALYYLVLVSTHIWGRPLTDITRYFFNDKNSVSQIRFKLTCYNDNAKAANYIFNPSCFAWSYIKSNIDLETSKILYLVSGITDIKTPALLDLRNNANIDTELIYNYDKIDFKKYDYLLLSENLQYITNINTKKNSNLLTNLNYKIHGNKVNIQKKAPYYCMFYMLGPKVKLLESYPKKLQDYPISAECFFDEDTFTKLGFGNPKKIINDFTIYERVKR